MGCVRFAGQELLLPPFLDENSDGPEELCHLPGNMWPSWWEENLCLGLNDLNHALQINGSRFVNTHLLSASQHRASHKIWSTFPCVKNPMRLGERRCRVYLGS